MEGSNAVDEKDTSPIYIGDRKRSLGEENTLLPEKKASPVGKQETTNAHTPKSRPLKFATITKIVHVPQEKSKYKEGRDQKKVCLAIMKKTGAQLELSVANQGLFISVSGTVDVVTNAIEEIVSQLQIQDSNALEIPKENHRFVIGQNRKVLRELELKTDTKIEIPGREDPSNQITITGTKEALEKAKHEILLISDKQDKHVLGRVNIDKVFHPFISGAHNKMAVQIMQETGAHIYVPPRNKNNTEIVVTGERQQVDLAMEKINEIFEDKKKNTTTIAVKVEKSQHKYVIGPRGQTVRDILLKTGVSVEIPPYGSSSDTVILRGEPGHLVDALTEVFVKASSYTVSSISAPSLLHGYIIGKKGQNLAKITQQMPKVHVKFIKGEDTVILKGPVQDVQMVQSRIEAIVKEFGPDVKLAEKPC